MSTYKLEVEKNFPVSAEMIFDAWLNPASVTQWMCPGEGISVPNPKIDATVGGRFEFDMQVGENTLPHRGEYKVIDRPKKLQFTWVSMNTKEQDSVVTVDIQSTGENSCKLVLMHELLPTEDSVKDHTGGWTRILDGLHGVCNK